jgi:hypothetical protein
MQGFIPEFGFKGKTFITFSNSYFQIWDSKTGNQIGNNIKIESRWSPIYNFNKKYILAAVSDNTIRYLMQQTEAGRQQSSSMQLQKNSPL